MKYIKDRFYKSRKTSPSLGAPAQDLFTREERTAFSCGLWVQRYDKFLNPPNIWRSFFRRSFFVSRWTLIRASASLSLLINLASESSHRLRKRFDQLSSQPNPNRAPDTSDRPFFGVANAKVRQLFESTKFSEKFFSREPHPCFWHLLYIGVPKIAFAKTPDYI